ncbi:unnamed protein product [Umbelopsis ramanniana]
MKNYSESVVHFEAGQQVFDVFDSGAAQRWNIDPLAWISYARSHYFIQDNVSDNDSNLEIFPDFIPVEEERNRLGCNAAAHKFFLALSASLWIPLKLTKMRVLWLTKAYGWEEKKAGQADKFAV